MDTHATRFKTEMFRMLRKQIDILLADDGSPRAAMRRRLDLLRRQRALRGQLAGMR
jgi:hypothetical protein